MLTDPMGGPHRSSTPFLLDRRFAGPSWWLDEDCDASMAASRSAAFE
jgi:hypothetical protein